MLKEYKHPLVVVSGCLVLLSVLALFVFQVKGYDTSMGWSLSTDPQFEEIITYQFGKGPFEFQIAGEKVTLLESYYGDQIKSLPQLSLVYFLAVLFGLVLVLASATYFKQYSFLIVCGLFILFFIQLKLDLLTDLPNWVVAIPIVLTIGPAYGFQAFWYRTTFLVRVLTLCVSCGVLLLLLQGGITTFPNHFFAYGTIPLMLGAFVFIALVAEEILFGLLFVLTKNSGGASNHIHMMLIGGIYVANLLGYYLNKAGLVDFSFTFMNPYLLLVISSVVAAWSFRYKYELLKEHILFVPILVVVAGLGLVTFALLGFGFARGLDGIFEGLHYVIIYAHLGFGAAFLIYIIMNFIDPLAKGLQVFKVVYKPQSFHYVTARLMGLVAILVFFFLSSQAALNLFRGVKYDLLGDIARQSGDEHLAITYYENAHFYSYNGHYHNYRLGTLFLNKSRQDPAREYYLRSSSRHPSPQSFLNTSNLQREGDVSLATAMLESGFLSFPNQAELKNNLGLLHLRNERLESAYNQFRDTPGNQTWNQAPVANKWATLNAMRTLLDESALEDYSNGNLVVQANVLSALMSAGQSLDLPFDTIQLSASPYALHRQAFLINANYYVLDSALSAFTTRELALPVLGLQGPLRKAQAMNLYLSGQVRSAFHAYDQIQNGMTGVRAAEVLQEMGFLALDQHAPREAMDFFLKAEERGLDTRFNQLVALLELGEYGSASVMLSALQAFDSLYYSLDDPLANVFLPGTDTTQEAQFNFLYYRFNELNPAEISRELQKFNPASQQIIIQRIAGHAENIGLDLAAYEGLDLTNPTYDHLDSTRLMNLAVERPFNEILVGTAAEKLSESDAVQAYNLVSQSLEFNPYSVSLLKLHAFLAVDINLPDYASNSIIKLSNILPMQDYLLFEQEWYQRKAEKELSNF